MDDYFVLAKTEENKLKKNKILLTNKQEVEAYIKVFRIEDHVKSILEDIMSKFEEVEIELQIFNPTEDSKDRYLCFYVRKDEYNGDKFIQDLDDVWRNHYRKFIEMENECWIQITTDFQRPKRK